MRLLAAGDCGYHLHDVTEVDMRGDFLSLLEESVFCSHRVVDGVMHIQLEAVYATMVLASWIETDIGPLIAMLQAHEHLPRLFELIRLLGMMVPFLARLLLRGYCSYMTHCTVHLYSERSS